MEESVKNNEICDFNLRKIRKMQKRCKQIIEKYFFIVKTTLRSVDHERTMTFLYLVEFSLE